MDVDEFNFALPSAAIAQRPAVPRDAARLLEVGETLADGTVADLPDRLQPGDLLVVNDTRVIAARLVGRRGAARIVVTLHKEEACGRWRAFARPARRLQAGQTISFAADSDPAPFTARVEAKGDGGEVTLVFDRGGTALSAALEAYGTMPLPPYIKRPALADARDRRDYQTIFAARPGAIAAPTAGLHFTSELLAALTARGIAIARLTLHVGAGTFLPVRAQKVEDHVIHAEWGEISEATADAVNAARSRGGRIVAVGTTSLRLLETAADESGRLHPFAGETNLFITPGFQFRAADLLLTNFHLPRSTLFMLVCAFAGTKRMKDAYAHALKAGYRFYSYGDCCLLHCGGTQ